MRKLRQANGPDDVARSRVEAFSDGVFAIVVTLLVFELKPPDLAATESIAALAYKLWELTPKLVSWVISFATVCVIWLNHCRLFSLTSRIDNGLFWRNANLLLWTSFLPFPTALLGNHPHNAFAVSFYGVAGLMMAVAFVLVRLHLHRRPELLRDDVDHDVFCTGTLLVVVMGPTAYIVGICLAWFNQAAAFACYAAISLYFVLPHAMRSRR